MSSFSPNLYLAALGPLLELLGVLVVVMVFLLLRAQADRRPYFHAWERAFVFFAVSLTAGLFYERFVDPTSVFYPASPVTTKLTAMAYLGFRLLAAALFVNGAQFFVQGTVTSWLPKAAVGAGIVLAFLADTTRTPLAPLGLLHGPLGSVAFAYAAILFARLSPSRQTVGTRFATVAFAGLASLLGALAVFYLLQHLAPVITGNPWLVRFERYGFYLDLILSLTLAWSLMRLLFEDGQREAGDTKAHLRLVRDRGKLGDLYDARSRLLSRRAFESFVGLDFARASFGSLGLLRVANYHRVSTEAGPDVAEALVAHVAGVLDSAVRAHDRVYRWGPDELLIVMPRAVVAAARARIEAIAGRIAPLLIAGSDNPLRCEAVIAVQFYAGGEELGAAATAAAET